MDSSSVYDLSVLVSVLLLLLFWGLFFVVVVVLDTDLKADINISSCEKREL